MQGKTARDALLNALVEKYECIYDIDAASGAYTTIFESSEYSELGVQGSGPDFFDALKKFVPREVHPDDVDYVLRMLSRTALTEGVRSSKQYSIKYRLFDGREISNRRIRAVLSREMETEHIFLGVINIDADIAREKEHREEIDFMRQKERNYLAAVLGSAEGYIEANLTADKVTEYSEFFASMWDMIEGVAKPQRDITYTEINNWICESMVISNKGRFMNVSGRESLLRRFESGDMRDSVQFYSRTKQGSAQPCRYVIFLYQDNATEEVHAFCVLYDLTQQQRKELELKKLEEELQLSRISNFTSQMQPHFLYNTLGSIQEVMLEDPEYASELLGDFAVHLRSCIRAMSADKPIPFSQELNNIKAYVNIEKMRFGEKLRIVYDIQTDGFDILPLSVQPLVENAIRHGIYGRGPAGGTVKVSTRETGDAWVIEVEDDGVGFDIETNMTDHAERKDHTGLKNITFRLKAVMGGKVDICSEKGKGTKAVISLPRERSSDESDRS